MVPKIFTDFDRYLFFEGKHCEIFKYFGAHKIFRNGSSYVRFAVWAPHAVAVFVIGDFNEWQGENFSMNSTGKGIWEIFIEDVPEGASYKYKILKKDGSFLYKADPVAFAAGFRPETVSLVCELDGFTWTDEEWNKSKLDRLQDEPLNIYEVHFGSWRKHPDGSFYTYRELAEILPQYVKEMGYTHIEIMPLAEHPLDQSWGYQTTGYYAPTSRYGSPQDLMYFVNACHNAGIGVILDWVAGHFCKDEMGLSEFDGTFCYEPNHFLRRDSDEWGTSYFDFDTPEVRSFLISNAIYWLEVYHFDGLRVDAVSSMLYLDYKKEKWLPNHHGSWENYGGIGFLRDLNQLVLARQPEALIIAEEATSFPKVTGSPNDEGLGFTHKWNLGWINDVLSYMEISPENRNLYHNKMTFSLTYAFKEKFVLPFSHDEVVDGRKSLLERMPGDDWQKFANLRLLFGYMMAHPGKKLTFMGLEFGQAAEWDCEKELDWSLLNIDLHEQFQHFIKKLNILYLNEDCLWQNDENWEGFKWLDPDDDDHSRISFLRFGGEGRHIAVVCNFSEIHCKNYRLGVPDFKGYHEIFNSNASKFGGSGKRSEKALMPEAIPWQGQKHSLAVDLPPLSIIYLSCE